MISEEIAADIMSFWNSITNNEHAPIAVVVAQSLPKFAQLEWQVLACGYERPRGIVYFVLLRFSHGIMEIINQFRLRTGNGNHKVTAPKNKLFNSQTLNHIQPSKTKQNNRGI